MPRDAHILPRAARAAALAALTALVALVAAPNAQASSIVFIRDGDVWLTTPDGSRQQRVAAGSYTSVTQADDGTIFASAGGILHRLSRDGRPLGVPSGTGHTLDLDVSPDGSKLTFWYLTSDGGRHTVIDADGTPAPGWDDQNGTHPTWITNDLTLQSNGAGYLMTTHAGLGGWTFWTGEPAGRKHGSAITRTGDRLVAVIGADDGGGPWRVAHYSNTAAPPRESADPLTPPPADQRPVLRCVEEHGATEPRHPRFSPDGTSIAWEVDGRVRVLPVFDLATCTQPPGAVEIADAISPDWGPAGVPSARGCVVPRLQGKRLPAARKALRRARCRLGTVRRERSSRRTATVIRHTPGAGARRPARTKVSVVVARAR